MLAGAKAGEDFVKLAEQHRGPNEDSKGDLGTGYGMMVQPFEEAAFAPEEGEISGIVRPCSVSYNKVFEKTNVDPTPFDKVG